MRSVLHARNHVAACSCTREARPRRAKGGAVAAPHHGSRAGAAMELVAASRISDVTSHGGVLRHRQLLANPRPLRRRGVQTQAG